MTARVYLHPTLVARRAADIARRQPGKLGRDACGRPFVLPSADPLAQNSEFGIQNSEIPYWERLIRALRALIPARQAQPPSRGEVREP